MYVKDYLYYRCNSIHMEEYLLQWRVASCSHQIPYSRSVMICPGPEHSLIFEFYDKPLCAIWWVWLWKEGSWFAHCCVWSGELSWNGPTDFSPPPKGFTLFLTSNLHILKHGILLKKTSTAVKFGKLWLCNRKQHTSTLLETHKINYWGPAGCLALKSCSLALLGLIFFSIPIHILFQASTYWIEWWQKLLLRN